MALLLKKSIFIIIYSNKHDFLLYLFIFFIRSIMKKSIISMERVKRVISELNPIDDLIFRKLFTIFNN